MLKWAVAPDDGRRRGSVVEKRRKLTYLNKNGGVGHFGTVRKESEPRRLLQNKYCVQRVHNCQHACGRRMIKDDSESKSLFYMSLDHLPLAIVKQYEKMIPEAEDNELSNPRLKNNDQTETMEAEMVVRTQKHVPMIKEAVNRSLKQAKGGVLLSYQKYSDSEEDSTSSCTTETKYTKWPLLSEKGQALRSFKFSNQFQPHWKKMSTKSTKANESYPDPDFLHRLLHRKTPTSSSSRKFSLKRRELRKLEKLRAETDQLNRFLRKYYHDCLPALPPEDEGDLSPEKKSVSSFLHQLAQSMQMWDKSDMTDSSTDSTPSDSDSQPNWKLHEEIETQAMLPAILEDTEFSSDSVSAEMVENESELQNYKISDRRRKNLIKIEARSISFDPPQSEVGLLLNSSLNTLKMDNGPVGDDYGINQPKNFQQTRVSSTSTQKKKKRKTASPKILVGRNHVQPYFCSVRGEVLARTYKNGNYVTLHVVKLRNLFHYSTSSWKLSFKVSFLPDEEEKVRGSEAVVVEKGQRSVSIDQKFSFEKKGEDKEKVFLTFWKRTPEKKRNTFFGWTGLDLTQEEQTGSWFKLKKEKMSGRRVQGPPRTPASPNATHSYDLRPTLQNSSTMDSGVEDCCSGIPNPQGTHLHFSLQKGPLEGFGFTVFWSSPPQIGRVKENTAADEAGIKTGDIIFGVNGEDISALSREVVIPKMMATGNRLQLEVWREAEVNHHNQHHCSSLHTSESNTPSPLPLALNGSQTRSAPPVLNGSQTRSVTPVSILKPAQPLMPHEHAPPLLPATSWKIRFNVEFLEKEEEVVKEFLICELKFFRKVVAALDRYLIPAQSRSLLTPTELHGIFSHVIKIITITKRILDCVSHGGGGSDLAFGTVLLRTHIDHLPELLCAYTSYAKNLGSSATTLADKMTFQLFARFVLETPVPKGHLDMTSLLFAPLEHLRNLCEISEEIQNSLPEWAGFGQELKECYADIACETDYMEPISHISMKKQPLLSVRHLEKRIVSTKFQDFKVCEKGRRWLFGSRLFRKESDGSFSPVWAFLFTDILVLTSHHTTRDRVFFVKDSPVRLSDVVTLHFNIPRKQENEFRLVFGPEVPVQQSRLDRLLLKNKGKKQMQLILRTPNTQLKNIWKLLLQRQIINLNTRISKSSSSNFSISEFCEKFPVREVILEEKEEETQASAASIILEDPTDSFQNTIKLDQNSNDYVDDGGSEPITKNDVPVDEIREEDADISEEVSGNSGNILETRLLLMPTAENPNEECNKFSSKIQIPKGTNPKKMGSGNDVVPKCVPVRRTVHQDSPMIGTEGRRRRILYDYKIRRDYPELFGISPKDRRAFIKSLGSQVIQNSTKEDESLVTPYYYVSPAPSPLPTQKQAKMQQPNRNLFRPKLFTRNTPIGSSKVERESLNLFRLKDLVEEEGGRRQQRSPEESSSNDSGISDDHIPMRAGSSIGPGRLNEVTPPSTLPRLLERKHTPPKGKMEGLVAVEKVDKATETEIPEPIPIKITNYQRRQAFFSNQSESKLAEHSLPLPVKSDPFIVKIFQGEPLHVSPLRKTPAPVPKPTERVQYRRLEEERTASLERVESSDDSTSSDAASASPAGNENGTTDPSWSSSTSSLGKDEFKGKGAFLEGDNTKGPKILITKDSPTLEQGLSESNASTLENYGDEDDEYNFDEDEDLSHCSVANMNRYGTFESLEKLENEDSISGLPEISRALPRSKARFAFDEDEEEDGIEEMEDEEDLFEEDFESDFNFRFPMQIQDNTYSVSRLGPLPPLLEEDYEDEMYEESYGAVSEAGSSSNITVNKTTSAVTSSRHHHARLRSENSFLLSRIATMYARSSISPLKIFRDLWLKKRYREWGAYKE